MTNNIEIPEEKFVPLFSNLFSVSKNDANEFVIDFGYNEPQKPNQLPKAKVITRIALSKVGAEKLMNLLQMALKQQPPSQGSPPSRF